MFFYFMLFSLLVVIGLILALSPELVGLPSYLGTQGIAKALKSIPRMFLSFWSLAVFVYSLQLSTTLIPNEMSERSIVPILSRPLSRVQFLAGKWIGLFAFVCLCIGMGKIVETIYSLSLGMKPQLSILTSIAFCQDLVNSLKLPALGLALTAFLSGGVGLVWAFLISVVVMYRPERFLDHSWAAVRAFAYACSIAFPISVQGSRFTSAGAENNLFLQCAVLSENILLLVGLFLLSALIFLRRDLRV